MAEFIGGPIDEGVVKQLNVRSDVLSRKAGNETFLKSRLFNTAWINVVSSANLIDDVDNNGIKGAELAKRYILSGGSLTWNGTNFDIGGGIDFSGTSPNRIYNYSEAKGVRPRPGITGFQIVSKNRFGAIREATINFNVWSQEDLVNIERLYFRPGFHAVVEWGHSEFVNNDNGLETGATGVTSEFFNDLDTPTKIAGILKEATDRRDYNYDSFVGVIKNFSYSFRQDGGYDCVISIISKGEILDSIRLKSGDSTLADPDDKSGISNINILPYLFKILSLDKGGFLKNSQGQANALTVDTLIKYLDKKEEEVLTKAVEKETLGGLLTADQIQDFSDRINANSEVQEVRSKNKTIIDFFNRRYNTFITTTSPEFGITKKINVKSLEFWPFSGEPDYNITYLPLNLVLDLINEQIRLTQPTRKVPRFTNENVYAPFATLPDQITLDPTICMIAPRTVTPELYGEIRGSAVVKVPYHPLRSNNNIVDFHSEIFGKANKIAEASKENCREDDISNIFISTKLLLELCKKYLGGKVKPEESLATNFIRDMMDEVELALGSVNNFDIEYSTDSTRNEAYIVDRKVTPVAGGTKTANNTTEIPELPLTGLKSFISNLSIQTKISNQLGSQIAIAAQGSSTDADYNAYVANYKEWNRNLYDRFDVVGSEPEPPKDGETKVNFDKRKAEVDLKRINLVKRLQQLYKDWASGTFESTDWEASITHGQTLYSSEEELEDLLNDRPPKGLIPTELSFTMDGIGGLKIGQSFKVQKGILPFTYDRYGYIITGLEHSIQNGKWFTTVRAQTFILQFDN